MSDISLNVIAEQPNDEEKLNGIEELRATVARLQAERETFTKTTRAEISDMQDRMSAMNATIGELCELMGVSLGGANLPDVMTREERFETFTVADDDELIAFVVSIASTVSDSIISRDGIIFKLEGGKIIFDRLPFHLIARGSCAAIDMQLVGGLFLLPATESNFILVLQMDDSDWNEQREAYRLEQRNYRMLRPHKFF